MAGKPLSKVMDITANGSSLVSARPLRGKKAAISLPEAGEENAGAFRFDSNQVVIPTSFRSESHTVK